MSKKTVILTITPIIVLAILVSILAVSIIEKVEKNEKETEMNRHGFREEPEESEEVKNIRQMLEQICETSQYNPYGKPFIMFAKALSYPEYDIEYPEYDKFISTEDYVWRCTNNSISEEYIGECIGTKISLNDKKEYKIYKIKDISSEYAVAFKETEPDCYMGLVNTEYAPENLSDFIEDTNLKNSDLEINLSFTAQFQEEGEKQYGIMTFIDEDEYLWNEFFKDNKYIYVDQDYYYSYYCDNYIEEFHIYIYQKTLKSIFCVNINNKVDIEIKSDYRYPYEFESNAEEVIKLINYIAENYEGYKEESPIQGPTLSDKNEFIQ